jgi:hypothetical protein
MTTKKRGRPTTIAKHAATMPLQRRVAVINQYHDAAKTCFAQGAMYALLCGFELHAAKEQVAHGEWENWVEKNCQFSPPTAWRYMAAAEGKFNLVPGLRRIAEFSLGVAPGALAAGHKQELLAALRGATDGETVRQMYLDLGIIKGPPPNPGGDHGGGAARAAKLAAFTPEAVETSLAVDLWAKLIAGLRDYAIVRRRWVRLDPADLRQGVESIKDCLRAISQGGK